MKLKTLAALAASFAFAEMSYGLTWTAETTTIPLDFLKWDDTSFTSSLNLASNGYNPATMNVTSATITFWFADDGSDGSEQVDLYANGLQVANDLEVDGTIGSLATYASYTFNLNSAGHLAAMQDGVVDFGVYLVTGDTYLKKVKIEATGGYKNVPDAGATSALLGLGVLGLVALRKRLGAAQ
jgi:hypothetical protein